MMKRRRKIGIKVIQRISSEDYSEPMPASGWERLERESMPVTEKRIYPYRPVGGCCGSCGIGGNDCCQFVFSE